MPGKTFEDISIGDSTTHSRTITAQDIDRYAEMTDDYNPMHMDDEYAKKTAFGGRIAHGPITLGLAAPVIGMKLPGEGCFLMTLNSEFVRPVRPGDTITLVGEVTAKNPEKRTIDMSLRFTNQHGEDVIIGSARVKPRKP
jgi:3-hydroxybutyryl-CoA dehydratase